MKLDISRKPFEYGILANFSMEATLYDTTALYGEIDNLNISSLETFHLAYEQSPEAYPQFQGYQLVGKVEKPKLWSAEHVSLLLSRPHFSVS